MCNRNRANTSATNCRTTFPLSFALCIRTARLAANAEWLCWWTRTRLLHVKSWILPSNNTPNPQKYYDDFNYARHVVNGQPPFGNNSRMLHAILIIVGFISSTPPTNISVHRHLHIYFTISKMKSQITGN